jgi:hypothetical protein
MAQVVLLTNIHQMTRLLRGQVQEVLDIPTWISSFEGFYQIFSGRSHLPALQLDDLDGSPSLCNTDGQRASHRSECPSWVKRVDSAFPAACPVCPR